MKHDLLQTTEKKLELDAPERLIGSVEGSKEGPLVIAMAGMHGNESAGVEALYHVFEILEASKPSICGAFWGVKANLKALEQGERYIDEDMNRIWFPSIVEKVKKTPLGELDSSERREMKQLLPVLEQLVAKGGGRDTIIIDLHTFSAEGTMFTLAPPQEPYIQLLSCLHAPMISGIETTLKGTAFNYFHERGHLIFTYEGGQHYNRITVSNTVAAVFMLLKEVGCIEEGGIPQLPEFEKHLKQHTKHVPARVELVYQHIIEPGDDFKMRPGFNNFDPVKKGEWLATDNQGKIRAEYDGFIVMPLYQRQGDDGFFIVRETV